MAMQQQMAMMQQTIMQQQHVIMNGPGQGRGGMAPPVGRPMMGYPGGPSPPGQPGGGGGDAAFDFMSKGGGGDAFSFVGDEISKNKTAL